MHWRPTRTRGNRQGGGCRAGARSRIALAIVAALTAETALVIGGTGQAMALPAQSEAAKTTAAKDTKGPKEAADIASARVTARLYGHRVEALSERTETSTTWANKDGS